MEKVVQYLLSSADLAPDHQSRPGAERESEMRCLGGVSPQKDHH